jgi:Domain of unknown function (DUF4177)
VTGRRGKEMRRAVLRRVVLAGMALLLLANLLSPWLVTPPPSYSAQGKIIEYKVSGVLAPDDLEPTLNKYGKEGWELVQLTPTGHLILRR